MDNYAPMKVKFHLFFLFFLKKNLLFFGKVRTFSRNAAHLSLPGEVVDFLTGTEEVWVEVDDRNRS